MASNGRDGRVGGKSRSTPSASASSPSTGRTLRAMETSWPSILNGSKPLTSSAAASPASPSPSLASDSPKPTPAGSGPSSVGSFAHYDPASSSWRTSQVCLDGELETFLGTWPSWGSMRNGSVYRREPAGLPTNANASGSWPTPRRTDGDRGGRGDLLQAVRGRTNQGGGMGRVGPVRPSLQTMARRGLWPTPKASPSGPDYARANRAGSGGDDLVTAVARLERFKTPTAAPASHGGGGGELHKQVQGGGPLNPEWVEWLMGFPMGWTAMPPSAAPSSRKSRSGSGDGS